MRRELLPPTVLTVIAVLVLGYNIGWAVFLDPTSKVFSIVIIILFFLVVIPVFSQSVAEQFGLRALFPVPHIWPAILTTIGILGTFYGIFIALLDFEPGEVDNITKLLKGLKIAFGTSIVGIVAGILSRMYLSVLPADAAETKIAKDLTKVLIDKINQELGSEFKALRESIKMLVDWQRDYSEQMKDMKEELVVAIESVKESRAALDDSAKALSQVEEATRAIPENMQHLSESMLEIMEPFKAFAELKEKAVEALPMVTKITGDMNDLTAQLSAHVQSINTQLEQNLATLRDELLNQIQETTQKINREMDTATQKALQNMANNLGSMANKTAKDYERFLAALRELHQQLVDLADKTQK